jgi:hypothetical protein
MRALQIVSIVVVVLLLWTEGSCVDDPSTDDGRWPESTAPTPKDIAASPVSNILKKKKNIKAPELRVIPSEQSKNGEVRVQLVRAGGDKSNCNVTDVVIFMLEASLGTLRLSETVASVAEAKLDGVTLTFPTKGEYSIYSYGLCGHGQERTKTSKSLKVVSKKKGPLLLYSVKVKLEDDGRAGRSIMWICDAMWMMEDSFVGCNQTTIKSTNMVIAEISYFQKSRADRLKMKIKQQGILGFEKH